MTTQINSYQDIHHYYDLDVFSILADSQKCVMDQLRQVSQNQAVTGTVIDIGCGTGNMLKTLTEQFSFTQIYGMDLSDEMLTIAAKKVNALIAICSSASALTHHFPKPTADLLLIHFLFAYVDYRNLIQQCAKVVKTGGLLSICTTTSNSFKSLQAVAATKIAAWVTHFLKFNAKAFMAEFLEFMPKDVESLTTELHAQGFEILHTSKRHTKISYATGNEAWGLLHNAGWFVGALHQLKLSKFAVLLIFYIIKWARLMPANQGRLEDTIEVIVLTARKV